MKILISAFTPFNGRKSNTSNDVLKLLSDEYETILLETSYEKSVSILKKQIEKSKPDFVLMLGESGKCKELELERLGINFVDATIADNDGVLRRHERIIEDGDDLLETKVDLSKIDSDFRVSYHAGTYVCNYLYYNILNAFKDSKIKSLFVHLSTDVEAKDHFHRLKDLLNVLNI